VISKAFETGEQPQDRFERAGSEAESDVAYYLNREFGQDPEVLVLHDIRLVDPDRPEHDGRDGVCQIDALVMHRHGMFIVESKSVGESIRVSPDGSGGEQWERFFRGRPAGMESALGQAKRQAEFLRGLLQRHRAELRGRVTGPAALLTKLVHKTDQRGFASAPIQLIVAVSKKGRIELKGGWRPPSSPYRAFLCKADQVPDRVREEIAAHRKGASLLGAKDAGEYGLWSIDPSEMDAVAQFLTERHTPQARGAEKSAPAQPKPAPPAERRPAPANGATGACKHCGSTQLEGRWGRYGYHWRCVACDKNTAMPTVCSACGTKGERGKGVKIRKEGPTYVRECEGCGIGEVVWRESV